MKIRVCKKCGCCSFYAHQIVRMDCICDGDGNFVENIHDENISQDIYDCEAPYGPFTCKDCNTEYNELSGLAEVELLTQFDIEKALKRGIITLEDASDGSGIICKIGEQWFYIGSNTTKADVSNIPAEQYIRNYSIFDISGDIFGTLEELKADSWDEYLYYNLYIQECQEAQSLSSFANIAIGTKFLYNGKVETVATVTRQKGLFCLDREIKSIIQTESGLFLADDELEREKVRLDVLFASFNQPESTAPTPIARPKCFDPEENNPYPLCIGRGRQQCQSCCLWANLEPPGIYDGYL